MIALDVLNFLELFVDVCRSLWISSKCSRNNNSSIKKCLLTSRTSLASPVDLHHICIHMWAMALLQNAFDIGNIREKARERVQDVLGFTLFLKIKMV